MPVNRGDAMLGEICTYVLFSLGESCLLWTVLSSSASHSSLAGHCVSRPYLQDNCFPALL